MAEYTLIAPIHNEEKYIYTWLHNCQQMKPTELLIGLDRCTDKTEQKIDKWLQTREHNFTVKIIYINERNDYAMQAAGIRRKLYDIAQHDTILNTSADILLDPRILNHLPDVGTKYGLISFGYINYPWNIRTFINRLISTYSPIHGFAGLLAVSQRAWRNTENLESLKKRRRAEDTHLHLAIQKRYPVNHVNTQSWHLRPREAKINHYNRGQAQYTLKLNPWWKAFLHSMIMLRPAVLTGYMHARRGIRC